MNAELLAMLGGSGIPGANSSRREEEGKTILTFKAGRMDPVLQPNGKYLITADSRRGQISLIFDLPSSSSTSNSTLKLEWKDRRTRSVVDSFTIIPEDRCTFAPIPTGREGERVYLLQFSSNPDRRFFYWMQDKHEPGTDEKHCVDMNKFLSNINECIIAAGGEPPPSQEASSSTATSTSGTGTANSSSASAGNNLSTSSSTTAQQQVDALSNILENLGMPPPTPSTSTAVTSAQPTSTTSTTTANNSTPANTSSGGMLTLADLQGAMAGLATRSPVNATTSQQQIHLNPAPPLTELATTEAIEESGIMNNPDVLARLMELLPEGQRTEEMLRDNLRSPQVQQALHNLTMALAGESGGDGEGVSMESYHSIIANFQMDAQDGAMALASGNPIQAFLDCLLASVKKENKEMEEEAKE